MQHFVFVRKNGRYEKIKFPELIFIKAMRGYMQIVTESQVYFVLNTIEEVQKYLPKELFCRTHKSYIVALERIQSFDLFKLHLYPPPRGKEYCPGLARLQELPIGKRFRNNLKESISIIPNRMGQKTKVIKNAEFILEYQLKEE